MGLGHAPSIVTDGLVLCLDAANYKSFKGVPATNILNQITYTSGNTNTALFKYTQGLESVNIPSLGYVNSKFVDIYNDYNGGSGNCCPTLFTFGTGATMVVSPSTTYTYSIIYKTTTGYTNANYMYRYERNSAGTVLTEAGVHSTNNRTSLGDGWWFAWGQFTTQATTAYLDTYLFHYEYATQNRVYVYKAALYAGTYIIPPEHMLNSAEVRGATVATGGGWADIIGNGNHGTLTNGPTYSSANGGSIVFDAADDYIDCGLSSFQPTAITLCAWVKHTVSSDGGLIVKGDVNEATEWGLSFGYSAPHYIIGRATTFNNQLVHPWTGSLLTGFHYVCYTMVNNTRASLYVDGVQVATTNTIGSIGLNAKNVLIGKWNNYAPLNGSVAQVKIYNRELTAAEVAQNFNALRGRYGV